MSETTQAATSPHETKVYSTVQEIPTGTAGLVEGQYIWKGEDPSRVFIFFCGAVSGKLIPMSPIFQRWKWVERFSHSVVIAHDPLIKSTGSLQLAWYTGTNNGPDFDEIISVPLRLARSLSDGEVCAFGSSGGGFASLMATVRNHVDSTLVINPQTNVLRYQPHMRDAFLKTYLEDPKTLQHADHERLSISGSLWRYYDKCRTQVVVNSHDSLHYNSHVLPLQRAVRRQNFKSITFDQYDDKKNGHNPPSMNRTLWLINRWWPKAIAGPYRSEVQGMKSLKTLKR
ncbi:hypothetical protein [Neptunicoccus cionae]|uniref:Uncharacterized protein n=1 Tax=Neptunicoccus cionae TaxID=2035344 RepID=A0A916QZU7_9RHOB|nr:hypothetical protein [Amylibacter cionae]GGA22634.1 hypothetical protein GCM10011498_24270 [Amylibacter cionae]